MSAVIVKWDTETENRQYELAEKLLRLTGNSMALAMLRAKKITPVHAMLLVNSRANKRG